MSQLLPVYKRYELTLSHGRGAYLWDTQGRRYLDFAAGIGVNALGHAHPRLLAALNTQAAKLIHAGNIYHHELLAPAAAELARAARMREVFFTNSGTEAIEGLIKLAMKFFRVKKGADPALRPHFIAFKNSFHGRSLGALSLTHNPAYRTPFEPLLDVSFADFNEAASVEALVNERTAAIFIEPVQGEGGVRPAGPGFLAALRRICDEREVLLIFDEIQCGMGRSGDFFAYQNLGTAPDALACAKALGGGLAVGAFALGERAKGLLGLGEHGSTFGGGALALAALRAVFEIYAAERILEGVKGLTPKLEAALDELVRDFDFCQERRGLGLMQGLALADGVDAEAVIRTCQEKGLLLIKAGENELRLLPPLIITQDEISKMQDVLREVFGGF